MLALRVEHLTGRSVSSSFNDRDSAEWPPHPARLFSALVAAWADEDPPCPRERAALEWIECAGAPSIVATEAAPRTVATHYVPDASVGVIDNVHELCARVDEAADALTKAERLSDKDPGKKKLVREATKAHTKAREALDKALGVHGVKTGGSEIARALALMPEHRSKQARVFPSVTPRDPAVHYVWSSRPPGDQREALARLALRVTRLGHSSSLVHCRLVEQAPEPTLVPDPKGGELLRVAAPGLLRELEREYEQHQGARPRVLPCAFQRYRRGADEPAPARAGAFGGDWTVLRRVGGPRLPLTRAVDVASAVRGALLKYAEDPRAEVLSGHAEDGTRSERPHLAIVPLPNVGHVHADGSLLGVALIFPRAVTENERRVVLRALGRWEQAHRTDEDDAVPVPVQLGAAGVIELERVAWGEASQSSLRPRTWQGPSRSWMTVTPIALDRNPGDLFSDRVAVSEAAYRSAAEIIAKACEDAGLGLPERVTVLPSATMPGTMKARAFPPFPPQEGRIRRVKVHAHVVFPEPVVGPVLLGAGRYLGLGLLRPVEDPNDHDV